jgi:hypothetical protein
MLEALIIIIGISVIVLIAEACYIMPDKFHWNKDRRNKK